MVGAVTESRQGDGRAGAKPSARKASPPSWRDAFDAVERPVATLSEAWIQTDVYMDAAAVAYKVQRKVTRELRRGVGQWLGLWDVPTRRDVSQLVNQVASLERQVRDLARQIEERDAAAAPAARPRRSTSRGQG
jgi:hypothetical protein